MEKSRMQAKLAAKRLDGRIRELHQLAAARVFEHRDENTRAGDWPSADGESLSLSGRSFSTEIGARARSDIRWDSVTERANAKAGPRQPNPDGSFRLPCVWKADSQAASVAAATVSAMSRARQYSATTCGAGDWWCSGARREWAVCGETLHQDFLQSRSALARERRATRESPGPQRQQHPAQPTALTLAAAAATRDMTAWVAAEPERTALEELSAASVRQLLLEFGAHAGCLTDSQGCLGTGVGPTDLAFRVRWEALAFHLTALGVDTGGDGDGDGSYGFANCERYDAAMQADARGRPDAVPRDRWFPPFPATDLQHWHGSVRLNLFEHYLVPCAAPLHLIGPESSFSSADIDLLGESQWAEHGRNGKGEKGVRLAQKIQVGPCIPVGVQL
jgi:hypothetical protein